VVLSWFIKSFVRWDFFFHVEIPQRDSKADANIMILLVDGTVVPCWLSADSIQTPKEGQLDFRLEN
jgi:hypothetical protein